MDQLRASIESRFAFLFDSPNLALLCALLDPRYASLPWVKTEEEKERVWDALLKEAFDVLNVTPTSEAGVRIHWFLTPLSMTGDPAAIDPH